jgi:hypothetical protein
VANGKLAGGHSWENVEVLEYSMSTYISVSVGVGLSAVFSTLL